ncbi:MAG: PTS sugar transporter subunit IIB [candidate division WOR-3 bacterium]
MKKVLFLIDDRGLHNQIVFGWLLRLNPKGVILLASGPPLADNERLRKRENFLLPEGTSFSLSPPEEVLRMRFREKTVVIIPSLKMAYQLLKGGLKMERLNITGLRFQKGRRRFFSSLYLSSQELSYLKKIIKNGVKVFFQELPTSKSYNLGRLFSP